MDPILLVYIILGALALIIVYFLIASVFWYQDESKHKKPVRHQFAQELTDLHLPEKKMQATVERMVEIVNREVVKETQKVRQEVEKTLEVKEKQLTEATKRTKAVEENYQLLGKRKTQTESVVRSIAKGVIVLDDEGKVVFLNPIAEKILGQKAKDLMGQQIKDMKGNHVISMVDAEGVEEKVGDSQGAKEHLKEQAAVIETVHGQTRGVLSIVNTESQRKIEEYKTEFLANITHELRSPLICIQKSIASVRDKIKTAGEEKDYLEIAIRNAERLEKLVNEILDLSRLESGIIYLRYDFIMLQAFLKEICDGFSAWAKDKQIHLEIDMPDEPVAFEADKIRLGQVLANFIANAVKFTPRGGRIVVSGYKRHEVETHSEWVEVKVKDSGPGIEEADCVNIFKKFAFINTQPTEGEKSTGLGLSIAKEIIDMHKGRIWVESKIKHGSIFGFTVPMTRPLN